MSSDGKVLPLIRVIANGADSNKRLMRATIVISPRRVESDEGIEFSNWPEGVAKWLDKRFGESAPDAELRLSVIRQGNKVDITRCTRVSKLKVANWNGLDWNAINSLWQACLAGASDAAWDALAKALDDSLDCSARNQASLAAKYDVPETPPSTDHFDVDGALLASAHDANPPTVGSVLPIKHADLAVDEERRRALRVMCKMTSGPRSVPHDMPVKAKDGEPPTSKTADEFHEKVRQYHWKRYAASVRATNDDREASAKALDGTCETLKGRAGNCGNIDYRNGDCCPIPCKEKADTASCEFDRASHIFGTWLQRRADLKHERDATGKIHYAKPDELATKLDPVSSNESKRLLAMFHALQDDPVLSRVFFLAVDVEFSWPEAFPQDVPTYLHLWFGKCATGDSSIVGAPTHADSLVATAARLQGDAFWPVSAFEAGIAGEDGSPLPCIGALVEQQNGIWRLGMGGNDGTCAHNRAPRYDLVSLDVRRAVDSKPRGIDRGERQITSGFTVLDRGRVHQILREMALADRCTQGGTSPVVLHAEDLIIGRRVDIAAVRPGSSIDSVQWRSLMLRTVSYHFAAHQNAMETAIARLLPRIRRDIDQKLLSEGSFQVVARHVPRVPAGDGEQLWDVSADEAIYSWDGTPAAVLTDPGQPQETHAIALAYRRIYDMPSVQYRKLLPPPLRYGVPYVLSMRSVFVGGGSPSPGQTARFHADTKGQHMLPPSKCAAKSESAIVAPRRFLRHESILAPTLLLPSHLATRRYGLMGFEQLDQAIVRTGYRNAEAALDGDDSSRLGPDGSPYASLGSRILPEETMRVFVAPEASFEDVVRHGRLDVDDPKPILRGGLLSVGYEHVHRGLTEMEGRTGGFPYVVTDRYASLDPEGAVYHRRPPTDRERRNQEIVGGIPIFMPGGKRNVPDGDIGWLPDPSVHQFSIRARIRGSDNYLADDLTADLYDKGIRYPNALPLVLEIKRKTGSRHKKNAVMSILDLTGGVASAPLTAIDSAGNRSRSGTTRVRYFELVLYEGEDFDLEVACLPRKETFAHAFSLPETLAIQWMLASSDAAARQALETFCDAVDLTICEGIKQRPMTGIGGYPVPEEELVKQCADSILKTMRTRWPIEEVAAVARLRVCHAVNRPDRAPVLQEVSIRRPLSATACDRFSPATGDDPGATALLLTGRLAINLEHIDAFEIIAETTGTNGMPLDDRKRARSAISRRSGRWPTYTTPTGGQAYVSSAHVFGFKVEQDGRVSLPREKVTLLRVDNLPVFGAIGDIVKPGVADEGCTQDGSHLFPDLEAGKGESAIGTTIDLGVVHAGAMLNQSIFMHVARPEGTKDIDASTRTIRLALPHSIADTRARELRLQVRGLSRFAETFETAPVYIRGKEQLLHRRQPLSSRDQSVSSDSVTVWSCATARPAACEPLLPEPSFLIDRATEDDGYGGRVHHVERHTLTRLYFKRGWFSSGEGERLGIVLWPPDYFDESKHTLGRNVVSIDGRCFSIAVFEDKDLGMAGAYITRWGGDPIRKDARRQDAVLIPTKAFGDVADLLDGACHYPALAHDPRIVASALMPVPTRADSDEAKQGVAGPAAQEPGADKADQDTADKNNEPEEYLRVSLLTYEPCFDIEREEWYVDVNVRPSRPSEPFIRFGLVRFQPHAIREELCVSEPVTVTVQLLPSRRLRVYVTGEDETGQRLIVVSMRGAGSSGIKDLRIAQTFGSSVKKEDIQRMTNAFEKLQHPWMRVWIFHEARDEAGAMHRMPIIAEAGFGGSEVQADVEDDELAWNMSIKLPNECGVSDRAGTLVAYVEEIDRRMPATYEREPVEPTAIFDERTFIDSGPRFSARVPLTEVKATSLA